MDIREGGKKNVLRSFGMGPKPKKGTTQRVANTLPDQQTPVEAEFNQMDMRQVCQWKAHRESIKFIQIVNETDQ